MDSDDITSLLYTGIGIGFAGLSLKLLSDMMVGMNTTPHKIHKKKRSVKKRN